MAWFTRSRLVYDAFKRFNYKLFPKNPIQSTTPRINSNITPLFYNQYKSPGIFGNSSFSWKLGNLSGKIKRFSHYNQNRNSLYSCVRRRNYYVDKNQVHHFKRRFTSWYVKPVNAIFGVVCCGVAITAYYGNFEVVPYSKRKHFVALSRSFERSLGVLLFKSMKREFEGKILPNKHPVSVRVNSIANNIVEALNRGVVSSSQEHAASGLVHDTKSELKVATEHLKHMKWEVIAVNERIINAYCLPGGKIVVFSGLLKVVNSDSELATIIGHEVGHAVARHTAEVITQLLGWLIFDLVLCKLITPNLEDLLSGLLFRTPHSRKMEVEADYIGLMLMASAGYDPRIAPQVQKKLGKRWRSNDDGEPSKFDKYLSKFEDYCSTHPSGQRRAQLLARDDVMDKALEIYRQAVNTRRRQAANRRHRAK